MADIDPVYDIIKHVDDLRRYSRYSQTYHQFSYVFRPKLCASVLQPLFFHVTLFLSLFFHLFSSLSFSEASFIHSCGVRIRQNRPVSGNLRTATAAVI